MSGRHGPTSTDRLVDELAARLRRIDLVGWSRIAACADELDLSLADLRLLLALVSADGPMTSGELTELSGLQPNTAYPALHRLHGRGYVHEDRRRYTLAGAGQELVATLDRAHREGVEATWPSWAHRSDSGSSMPWRSPR